MLAAVEILRIITIVLISLSGLPGLKFMNQINLIALKMGFNIAFCACVRVSNILWILHYLWLLVNGVNFSFIDSLIF